MPISPLRPRRREAQLAGYIRLLSRGRAAARPRFAIAAAVATLFAGFFL
jgi:hypothetical protein